MANTDDYEAALELAAEFDKTIGAVKFLRDELGLTLIEAVAMSDRVVVLFPQSALAAARKLGK